MTSLRSCRLAILLCLFPAPGIAQIQPANLAGIAHVAFRVSDLTRSRIFYQKLGFEQAFVTTKDGKTTESFLKVNDHQFIEIYPQQDPSQSIGFMHVCFEATDLEALNHAYLGRSLTPTPVKRAGAGNLLFTMVGPEEQNIEYTQYMPGSLHTKDQGQHLGEDRISKEIVGISLSMEDPVAARAFYQQSLGFHESRHSLEAGLIPLLLPGTSNQMVEITPNVFQLLLSVPSLRHAASQLREKNLQVEKQGNMLTVKDPDGNRIVFVDVEAETGRRLLQMPKLPKIPWPSKP
jgi:catechol 2,3-dioxygenase-like lactoylglutathione lyase family enzyme